MVPSHICHIYGIWDLKEQRWGDALKLPFGVAMQATSGGGDNFNGEEGGGGGCHFVKMLHLSFICYFI